MRIFITSLFLLTTFISFSQTFEAKCLSGNCENGYGTYQFNDGTVYIGNFKNFKLNGKGKYTYKNGNTYDGEWVNAVREGQGTIEYKSGDSYSGSWKADKKHGFGKYKWSDGTRYEGDYKEDKMDGKGTIYYASGEKYVGECYNSKREGKGKHYDAKGKLVYDGYWKDNKESTKDAVSSTDTKNKKTDSNSDKETKKDDDYNWLDTFLSSDGDKKEEAAKSSATTKTEEKTQPVSSGNFCTDYKKVVDDSRNEFKETKGTLKSEGSGWLKTSSYDVKTSIAGSQYCYISDFLGKYYYAVFGEYTSQSDAEKKHDEILGKIKSCVSDKIYESGKTSSSNIKSTLILDKFKDSYYLQGPSLNIYKNSDKYEVKLNISTGWDKKVIYTIPASNGSNDATFDKNLKKVIQGSYNKFKEILAGTGNDVNVTLPGIFDIKYKAGNSYTSDEVTGVYYDGTEEATAKSKYNSLADKIKKTLGENYVYASSSYLFGKGLKTVFAAKNETREDKAAVVTVEYKQDSYSKKYTVTIVFSYKSFSASI